MPYLQLFFRGPLSSQNVASHIVPLRYHYCNNNNNSFENLIRCSVEGTDIRRCDVNPLLLPHRLIHILSQRTRTCTKETVSATSLNSQCVQNSRAHPNITIIIIDTNNQNDLRRVLLVKTETTDSRRQLQTISHHRNRDPRQSGVAENYIKEGKKKLHRENLHTTWKQELLLPPRPPLAS